MYILYLYRVQVFVYYRIAGKFGGGKIWQIDSFRTFGKRKFDELIDWSIDYLL